MNNLAVHFIFIFLFSVYSFGNDFSSKPKILRFDINLKKIEFSLFEKEHLMISSDCLPLAKINCKAYQAFLNIKKTKSKTATGDIYKGRHPGGALCEIDLKAEVTLGVDKDKNENHFCKFSDNSFLDLGSLFYASQD